MPIALHEILGSNLTEGGVSSRIHCDMQPSPRSAHTQKMPKSRISAPYGSAQVDSVFSIHIYK